LSDENISHNNEAFLYIVELHEYLWRFIKTQLPDAGGHIEEFLDIAIESAEDQRKLIDDLLKKVAVIRKKHQ